MPVSYQDFVLSNQYFGTPMPTDPQMKMELTPIVYQNMRTIGARPSRLQQGLRAVGRGLAIAGGAGLAVGVANSLFNKPSDNYEQAVTDNQTSGGRNTRVGQLDSFDDFFETDNEKYAKTGGLGESTPPSKSTTPAQTVSITDRVEDFIGPRQVPTETKKDLKYLNNVRSRFGRMQAQGFSSGLRNEDQDANIAAFHAENEAALRGTKPVYGPQELMGQGGMSISSGEEEDYRRKTGQSLKKYGLTDRTKPERRGQFRTDLILDKKGLQDKAEREQSEYAASPRYQEEQFRERMSRDTYVPPSNDNDPPLTEKVDQFINKTKSGKNLPEKKTQKVSDLGERRQDNASAGMKSIIAAGGDVAKAALEQTPDIDLSEIENDPALADIGRREDPQDVSPRGVIPPDKSGTINKTDLSAIGDIIGEKQADNPIIGGLQGIGKAARIAGKLGKRTVEELADKGAKDRRNYAKYKETIRKAQAFKKIAEDRENTKDPE